MPEHLLVTDADNTLWDTDAVYRNAQLSLLDKVERLAGASSNAPDRLGYLREVDQRLSLGHHSGLRYPPALLVLALRARLGGTRVDQAVRQALVGDTAAEGEPLKIVQGFFGDLGKLAPLRPGVLVGLARLAEAGHLVVVATEGAKDKIELLLEAHGLSRYVRTVVSAPKAEPLYRRLAKTASGVKMMVGDQIDRDIAPAKKAGFVTAWFPGGFMPRWSDPQRDAVDIEITSFDEATDAFLLQSNGLRPTVRAARRRAAL
jgi:putative hydrolase of the HAD superfamily